MKIGELKEKLALLGITDEDFIGEIKIESGATQIFLHTRSRGALLKDKEGWHIREIFVSTTPYLKSPNWFDLPQPEPEQPVKSNWFRKPKPRGRPPREDQSRSYTHERERPEGESPNKRPSNKMAIITKGEDEHGS